MHHADDIAFQRAILANPADTTLKLVYADWLQDRDDPRAEYVRLQLATTSPRNTKNAQGRKKRAKDQQRLDELSRELDPLWLAFMTTLAQPFVPIRFQDDEPGHPFTESVGHRGRIVAFESQYRSADDWSEGLLADLAFLTSVEWGECAYGAADYPMHGFVCSVPRNLDTPRAAVKFADLKLADLQHSPQPFRAFPTTVSLTTVFAQQYMFEREESPDHGNHGLLKQHVRTGHLWYWLLHIAKRPCQMVVLLAVGTSPNGDRLVGAITSQMCHSLCD